MEDPRLEAGARARCAFYGLNPDEAVLEKGTVLPLWKTFIAEVRTVIEAADASDGADDVCGDRLALRLKAKPGSPLAIGRNPEIADKNGGEEGTTAGV